MLDFYLTIVLAVLNVALPYFFIRLDRRRLSGDELARAWNTPTFACAVFFFGPLCFPAHFFVTRRKLSALFVGLLCTAAMLGAEWLLGEAVERIAT